MIDCEMTSCRNNSERDSVEYKSKGRCATYVLIRDKGWGPQCQSFDEMKDCYGSLKDSEKLSEVCKHCEDFDICHEYSLKKNKKIVSQKLSEKEETT